MICQPGWLIELRARGEAHLIESTDTTRRAYLAVQSRNVFAQVKSDSHLGHFKTNRKSAIFSFSSSSRRFLCPNKMEARKVWPQTLKREQSNGRQPNYYHSLATTTTTTAGNHPNDVISRLVLRNIRN